MIDKNMIKICILFLPALFLMVQSLQGNVPLHPGHIAWEIKPDGVWKERGIKETADWRKRCSHDLYEEILSKENSVTKKPEKARDIYGLNVSQYYLGGDEETQRWVLMDMMCNVYAEVRIFYSPDPVYSRQTAVEEMIIIQGSYTVNRNSDYKWTTLKEGIKMSFHESRSVYGDPGEKLIGCVFYEQGGYSLLITDYWRSPNKLKDKEVFQIGETILSALNGNRQFGYFPQRTRQLEKKREMRMSMPYEQRSRLDGQLRKYTKGMPEDMAEKISFNAYVKELPEVLGLKNPDSRGEEGRAMIPNINSGIGTLKWIKKCMNIPFTPAEGFDESHVNGLTGTFQIKENGRDYPVRYAIIHLHTKGEAIMTMLRLQATHPNGSGNLLNEEIVKKILQPNPRIVGDVDICLKPILNELGQPIPKGEHSWISFIRGNTVVMLKNDEMKVSVLPLARKIDEALLKNMELFMKPEEVR